MWSSWDPKSTKRMNKKVPPAYEAKELGKKSRGNDENRMSRNALRQGK